MTMPAATSSRRRRLVASILFHSLLLIAAGLLAWLGTRYGLEWDWSKAHRNSLSETSSQLLLRMRDSLSLRAFVRGDKMLRQQVNELVARYQRLKPDIELMYVNPDLHPQQARELGITQPIEIEVSYKGRQEWVKHLSEEALTNALYRVSRRERHWIASLRGHGERDILGEANHDQGLFGQELRRKGFHVQPLDLTSVTHIPDNARVLLIAGPQRLFLPGEIKRIHDYVARGGNLLWLSDPGDPQGPADMVEGLGIRALPGVVVDTNVSNLGLDDPAFALVSRYPDHPLTRDLKDPSLFPKAKAFEIRESEQWQVTPILRTLARSWNETGPIKGEVRVNPENDEHLGPLTVGIVLSRRLSANDPVTSEREQRMVVVGDGDFLSNTYLGNGGNLDLGLNILRWLSNENDLLQIPARTAPDRTLDLTPFAAAVIGLGFLLVLPLSLLGTGALIWWRRRRL